MNKVKRILFIGAVTSFVSVLSSQALAGESFPLDSWSSDLLDDIKAGPDFMDPDFDTGIPKPGADGSRQTQTEILDLRGLQSTARSADVVSRILIENDPEKTIAEHFRDVGFIPSREEAPALWNLIIALDHEVRYFSLRDKLEFSRSRPTAVEHLLTSVIDVPPHASYPSGHSAQFWATSKILSNLSPECSDDLVSFARDVAKRREIAGVHYASDTIAGRILADNVSDAFFNGPWINDLVVDLTMEASRNGGFGITCDDIEEKS